MKPISTKLSNIFFFSLIFRFSYLHSKNKIKEEEEEEQEGKKNQGILSLYIEWLARDIQSCQQRSMTTHLLMM